MELTKYDNLGDHKNSNNNIVCKSAGLKYLPDCPPVNIEFNNLVYSVGSFGNEEKKELIHNIYGQFRSNELTAIMGSSGGGKTTLLNILAGYSTQESGEILINGNLREMKLFKKMSRYIMQNEVLDKFYTVRESMMFAANLKLGKNFDMMQKNEIINEILDNLRLRNAENTMNEKLSGGEKKRLSIAMELVNNPSVIFLDEPTTGLDDWSSFYCISLLKQLAQAGRTIICSIHTPTAKLFQQFDNVYIISDGKCAFQGSGGDIVPFMQTIGLECPLTYNPADFIIEACSGEYGKIFTEKMINKIENGKCFKYIPESKLRDIENITKQKTYFNYEIDITNFDEGPDTWEVFKILIKRSFVRRYRDPFFMLNIFLHFVLIIMVGGIFQNTGNNATQALSNFGFAFITMFIFVYMPLMPIVAALPVEIKLVKREFFNQWYGIGPYYCAMMLSKIPFLFSIGTVFVSGVYLMSSQPLEWIRFLKVLSIILLTGITSDCFGVIIGSRFNIINGEFLGPVALTPMIFFSYYGFGSGTRDFSIYMKIVMNLCFLRHSLIGVLAGLYDNNRADTICPEKEIVCMFKKGDYLMKIIGTENPDYISSVLALFVFIFLFGLTGFISIKDRLSTAGSNIFLIRYFNYMFRKLFS